MGAPARSGTVYCTECGNPSPPSSTFCSRCGARVGATGPPSSPLPPSPGAPGGVVPPGWGASYAALPAPYPTVSPTVARDRERTSNGLLLVIIGLALSWLPYISALGGLLVLIGVVLLFMGRRAYGPEHQRFVVLGGILILITFLATILAALVLFGAIISAAQTPGATASQVSSLLQQDLTAFFVTVAVIGALSALARVLLPYGLADRTTRILLWAGFVTGVVISVVVLVVILPQVNSAISQAAAQASAGTPIDTGPIQQVESTATLLGLANGISVLFFVWAYYRAREEARHR